MRHPKQDRRRRCQVVHRGPRGHRPRGRPAPGGIVVFVEGEEGQGRDSDDPAPPSSHHRHMQSQVRPRPPSDTPLHAPVRHPSSRCREDRGTPATVLSAEHMSVMSGGTLLRRLVSGTGGNVHSCLYALQFASAPAREVAIGKRERKGGGRGRGQHLLSRGGNHCCPLRTTPAQGGRVLFPPHSKK